MSLKPIEEKAVRLVLENRVHIRWRNDDHSAGSGVVEGDTDTYTASFDPTGRTCSCPAGSNRRGCSHGIALELAVKKEADDVE